MAEERQKAKSKGFAALGVPVGSTLTFRKDSTITCKTVDEKNKVEYQGKVYPISGLAKELTKTPISGYHAFKFNGVLLAKLGKDSPVEDSTPADTPAPKPSETAPKTHWTPNSPTPQTVPLPPPTEAPVEPQEAESGEAPVPGEGNIDPLSEGAENSSEA